MQEGGSTIVIFLSLYFQKLNHNPPCYPQFAKCLGTASADFGETNPYNTRAYNYGPCSWDATNTLAIYYVYDLPRASRSLGGV